MADVPERLFRDDAGAAFERVARLEQENQQLRQELRRIKRPDEAPTLRTRKPEKLRPGFLVLGAVAGLGLGIAAITVSAHRDPPRASLFTAPLPPSPPGLIGVSTPVAPATVATADVEDCDTPFTYDEQGVKHYKQQCIHPERTQR